MFGWNFSWIYRVPSNKCQVLWPTKQQLRVVCNLKISKQRCRPNSEKSKFGKMIDVGLFKTNCPGWSYFYHIELIGGLEILTFCFRLSGHHAVPAGGRKLELKRLAIGSPWKVALYLQGDYDYFIGMSDFLRSAAWACARSVQAGVEENIPTIKDHWGFLTWFIGYQPITPSHPREVGQILLYGIPKNW